MPVRIYVANQARDMTDLAEALIVSGHEPGSSSTRLLHIPCRVLWTIEQHMARSVLMTVASIA